MPQLDIFPVVETMVFLIPLLSILWFFFYWFQDSFEGFLLIRTYLLDTFNSLRQFFEKDLYSFLSEAVITLFIKSLSVVKTKNTILKHIMHIIGFFWVFNCYPKLFEMYTDLQKQNFILFCGLINTLVYLQYFLTLNYFFNVKFINASL